MIRLYLISKGVDKSSIHILDEYPSSTYQNVKMVKQSLSKNNVDSILFITAPYHSRRATLLWKHNAPSIDIITPDVSNVKPKDIEWGIELDKMKIIAYEYAAIVHNWIAGRI
jgi:uncharacterized SAM-binding protein YcdF (DUF218 family)